MKTIIERGFGWRAGDNYTETGATVADVIRYEQEEHGNEDVVAVVPMEELDKIPSSNCVWLCRTRDEARYYVTADTGDAYRVDLEHGAFIAAIDNDGGYLIVNGF